MFHQFSKNEIVFLKAEIPKKEYKVVILHHRENNGNLLPFYYIQKDKKDDWLGVYEDEIEKAQKIL